MFFTLKTKNNTLTHTKKITHKRGGKKKKKIKHTEMPHQNRNIFLNPVFIWRHIIQRSHLKRGRGFFSICNKWSCFNKGGFKKLFKKVKMCKINKRKFFSKRSTQTKQGFFFFFLFLWVQYMGWGLINLGLESYGKGQKCAKLINIVVLISLEREQKVSTKKNK